jgi:hypothetical protein
VGGPENSLEGNYYYSIENDLNFIARRTDHTNVRFVNLLRRHDEPWINRKLRSVNLRLDQALLGHGMSHLSLINTTTIGREEYTTHGLHLNSRGKRSLCISSLINWMAVAYWV